MSAKEKDQKDPKAAATPARQPILSPEAEAQQRINALQESIKTAEGEIKTISGRLQNRDPALLEKLKQENTSLKERLGKLENSFYALLLETTKAQQSDLLKEQIDILRQSACEYFQKANINRDLWKNIVF